MNNGIVDILYSNRKIPTPLKHLIESVKTAITNSNFPVFQGPIYAQNHSLKVKNNTQLDYEDIIHMDWLVEGVEGTIPDIKTLTPIDPFSYMQDIIHKK